jgi:glycine cleavage system H protein
MNVPANLKYTKEHEWVRIDGDVATIGITEYAQGELGDIVFVELPDIGSTVNQMGRFGTVEAVKAVSDLFSPLSGTVVDINKALDGDPMVVNRDPYGEGWMIKVKVSSSAELSGLLAPDGYKQLLTA